MTINLELLRDIAEGREISPQRAADHAAAMYKEARSMPDGYYPEGSFGAAMQANARELDAIKARLRAAFDEKREELGIAADAPYPDWIMPKP